MTEHLTDVDRLKQANELLEALMDFAYEQGFHECGYNPAKVLNDEILRLREDLRRTESAHAVVMAENKHYKERVAELERHLNKATIEHAWAIGKLRGECAEPEPCVSHIALEKTEAALHRIKQWAEAYPLDVFPEPDWKRSAQALKDAGLSLDRISAANMRHVITQVQAIVDGTLSETTGERQ